MIQRAFVTTTAPRRSQRSSVFLAVVAVVVLIGCIESKFQLTFMVETTSAAAFRGGTPLDHPSAGTASESTLPPTKAPTARARPWDKIHPASHSADVYRRGVSEMYGHWDAPDRSHSPRGNSSVSARVVWKGGAYELDPPNAICAAGGTAPYVLVGMAYGYSPQQMAAWLGSFRATTDASLNDVRCERHTVDGVESKGPLLHPC